MPTENIDELLAKLGSDSPAVRYTAANKLGKLGDESAIDPLIDAMDDEDEKVRDNVIFALGELRALKSSHRLIRLVKSDKSDRIRKSAAKALGLMKAADALDALIGALKDTDFRVRKSAARSLGKIEDIKALPALREALKDPNYTVTKYVEDAIERLSGL